MSIFSSGNHDTHSAMITPALFMTANGSLIISTSNRMARIVDRIRVQNEANDALDRDPKDLDFVPERQSHLDDQVKHLERRSDHIRRALLLLYTAFGAFVGTSLTLAIDVWTGYRVRALPTALAVLGVSLMLAACVNLVLEALEALQSNHMEVSFFQGLRGRRRRAAARPAPDSHADRP